MKQPGEEVLFGTQQHRFVPGGKETSPSQIFVTTERVIIDIEVAWSEERVSGSALQRYHECCIEEEHLEQRHHILINSRFQGQIVMKTIGRGDSQKFE